MRYRNIDCPSITEKGKCTIDGGHRCVCLDGYCKCVFSHKHINPAKCDERLTEQELNDKFVRMVHGVKRADRLQQIWNMSYPHYKKTREEDFREKAKAEGYTDKQIDFFLKLP